MYRSEVNQIIRDADKFIRSHGIHLPPFAYWDPDEISGPRGALIRTRKLGWDVTDYGRGRFDELGLFLFTTRNGDHADLKAGRGMLYAEKVMISRADQVSPMHRHIVKSEDIINRGGGDLVVELFASLEDGSIDRSGHVTVFCDAERITLRAGEHLRLKPGQSVTLAPGDWHAFWADKNDVLIVEVSTVNDDLTDNVFEEPIERFSTIVEDELPLHLLVSDYA